MTSRPRVVILGGGPAGVGAAFRLSLRSTFDVTVLERQMSVGGNAGSFEMAGFHVDYGSHRLHPTCDPAVLSDIRSLLGADLLERPRHGRIRLMGCWLHFPLKPLDLLRSAPPRFAAGAARDALRRLLPLQQDRSVPPSFATVLRAGLGPTICEDFYFPYVRKIWGIEPEQISPVLAQRRIRGNSMSRLVRKVLAAAALSRDSRAGWFFYPRKGYGQISQRYCEVAAERDASFRFGAEVRAVHVAGNRVRAVEFQAHSTAETLPADHVWSTIPITSLARAVRPTAPDDVLESASRIHFRGMILVYLVLEQPRFTEFDAHYFPDAQTVISRLSEPRNYSGVDEPRPLTVLCAELPCGTDSPYWDMTDEQLGELVKADLARNAIPVSAAVSCVLTRRLPHAYPIYDLGFEQHFERIDRWLSRIGGLVSFGRQGLFAHDNTHHALLMAYTAADCLSDTGDFDEIRWSDARRQFESHVVED